MKDGTLIVIEGIDGSGKSTIVNKLHQELTKLKVDIKIVKEPSIGNLGKIAREYLRNPSSDCEVDALVFAADRAKQYFEVTRKLLSKKCLIISDRSKISSIVYQSSQGAKIEWLKSINSVIPNPDIVFYLDVTPKTAMKRLNSANRVNLEKFEKIEYLSNLKISYLEVLKNYNHIVINANQGEDQITEEILNILHVNKII